MKINTRIEAGAMYNQHNKKPKSLKALNAKLRINKETVKELTDSDLKEVAGGAATTSVSSLNHNEKLESEGKLKSRRPLNAKLRINKETVRELSDSDLKNVAGGVRKASLLCVSSGC